MFCLLFFYKSWRFLFFFDLWAWCSSSIPRLFLTTGSMSFLVEILSSKISSTQRHYMHACTKINNKRAQTGSRIKISETDVSMDTVSSNMSSMMAIVPWSPDITHKEGPTQNYLISLRRVIIWYVIICSVTLVLEGGSRVRHKTCVISVWKCHIHRKQNRFKKTRN